MNLNELQEVANNLYGAYAEARNEFWQVHDHLVHTGHAANLRAHPDYINADEACTVAYDQFVSAHDAVELERKRCSA